MKCSYLISYLIQILEKNLLNSMYEFLEENDLLCEHQSGFRPSDSCEYQLHSFAHDIYASFDCNAPLDVRGVFLDISKAFDRVWHDELIYKIKCTGINFCGILLSEMKCSYLISYLILIVVLISAANNGW